MLECSGIAPGFANTGTVGKLPHLDEAIGRSVSKLCKEFPVTRAIVGDRGFEELAIAHVCCRSEDEPDCIDFGRTFPAWLETEVTTHRRSYLSDIARCEHLCSQARNALNAPILELDAFRGIEPDKRLRLRLRLHPATQYIWLADPALEIWLRYNCGLSTDMRSRGRAGGILFAQHCRANGGAAIDAAQHRLLCGIRLGESLGKAFDAVKRLYPRSNTEARLEDLVQRGAFASTHPCRSGAPSGEPSYVQPH